MAELQGHMHVGPAAVPVGVVIDHKPEVREEPTRTMWREQAYETEMARYASFPASAVADQYGNANLQLGPVAQGWRWVVHHLVVGGITPAPVNGTAWVVVMPSNWAPGIPDAPPPLTALWDIASFLPQPAFYSRGEFVVMALSSIWVMVSGGTAGQTYAANCHFVSERANS